MFISKTVMQKRHFIKRLQGIINSRMQLGQAWCPQGKLCRVPGLSEQNTHTTSPSPLYTRPLNLLVKESEFMTELLRKKHLL